MGHVYAQAVAMPILHAVIVINEFIEVMITPYRLRLTFSVKRNILPVNRTSNCLKKKKNDC